MKMSDKGMCELASYEALILSPYLDSGGVKTVGIGSTSSDIPDLASWPWNKTLSVEEAVEIYRKGLSKYETAVNKKLNKEIPQHQFDALVSITYNIGVGGMANSTFMKLMLKGAASKDITNAMTAWNRDNGRVVQGLVNRRAKEASLFLTGQYASGGMVSLCPVDVKTHKPQYSKGKLINLLTYINKGDTIEPKDTLLSLEKVGEGCLSYLEEMYNSCIQKIGIK